MGVVASNPQEKLSKATASFQNSLPYRDSVVPVLCFSHSGKNNLGFIN